MRKGLCLGGYLFLSAPILPFLYEYSHPGILQYLGTAVSAFFYAIPWTIVSLIIALAILFKRKRMEE